ncbi:hypothetical protein I603_2477 [Erythrobacter dokdonensis DSW-74]|uniref:Uncharacterized protein n=1 Tax=Erythrobacter dokdonensis DSW-74 TaxID=1300349 RepID=A0A1A7BH26_9SPHN|nr:hypothetical protein I603_2477 [Erythrobacter dokdonensis DSW-74]
MLVDRCAENGRSRALAFRVCDGRSADRDQPAAGVGEAGNAGTPDKVRRPARFDDHVDRTIAACRRRCAKVERLALFRLAPGRKGVGEVIEADVPAIDEGGCDISVIGTAGLRLEHKPATLERFLGREGVPARSGCRSQTECRRLCVGDDADIGSRGIRHRDIGGIDTSAIGAGTNMHQAVLTAARFGKGGGITVGRNPGCFSAEIEQAIIGQDGTGRGITRTVPGCAHVDRFDIGRDRFDIGLGCGRCTGRHGQGPVIGAGHRGRAIGVLFQTRFLMETAEQVGNRPCAEGVTFARCRGAGGYRRRDDGKRAIIDRRCRNLGQRSRDILPDRVFDIGKSNSLTGIIGGRGARRDRDITRIDQQNLSRRDDFGFHALDAEIDDHFVFVLFAGFALENGSARGVDHTGDRRSGAARHHSGLEGFAFGKGEFIGKHGSRYCRAFNSLGHGRHSNRHGNSRRAKDKRSALCVKNHDFSPIHAIRKRKALPNDP